ncbi:two-component sensor histidine kinase [Cellulomonas sp. JZ18]|uniref:sensor histidine kinase n=1 Tax=Cellulomonas sp. JZ18 TaxID=2654191 RepID=UPI0012D3B8B5|nr:histidine kinase [Cellulomonas sp. JZ18]QGQ18515.1 two-component sensor histidine kinase [Cellulomonas sp. JZ18]
METARGTGTEGWWAARLPPLGALGPFARDVVLAVATAVLMLLVTVGTTALAAPEDVPAPDVERWVLLLVAVQSLALAVRRVRLAACVALVVATQVALVALAPDMSVRTLAAFVAAATLGTTLPAARALRAAWSVAAVEAVASGAAAAVRGGGVDTVLQHTISAVVVWGLSVLVGIYLATRREHLRLLQERAEQLERERDARVRAAVADERARLARELHDVAAHHLSGMVVQAAAVERLVGRDPDAARAGAAWLRDQGRETLDNLRQVVGLLRHDERDALAPVPGAAALDDLVAAARALGDDVHLDRDGEVPPLPPLADVSVYRVAQQALTNARQHAPGGAVRVRLAAEAGAVVLDVVNGPAAPGAAVVHGERGGTGLAVMRERAALVGGRLEAGRTGDGGWRVRLHVPVDDEGGRA